MTRTMRRFVGFQDQCRSIFMAALRHRILALATVILLASVKGGGLHLRKPISSHPTDNSLFFNVSSFDTKEKKSRLLKAMWSIGSIQQHHDVGFVDRIYVRDTKPYRQEPSQSDRNEGYEPPVQRRLKKRKPRRNKRPGKKRARQSEEMLLRNVYLPIYTYGLGNCPSDGCLGVPCYDPNQDKVPLEHICDKNNRTVGSFADCLEVCERSFCCIHDALRPPDDPSQSPAGTNFLAPNCNSDENCAQYTPCYIVWWKLHDTIGPATELRLTAKTDDDFFPSTQTEAEKIEKGFSLDLLTHLYLHHFDDVERVLNDAENLTEIFYTQSYWNTTL